MVRSDVSEPEFSSSSSIWDFSVTTRFIIFLRQRAPKFFFYGKLIDNCCSATVIVDIWLYNGGVLVIYADYGTATK